MHEAGEEQVRDPDLQWNVACLRSDDLALNRHQIRAIRHDEEALALAPRFPDFSDGAFLAGVFSDVHSSIPPYLLRNFLATQSRVHLGFPVSLEYEVETHRAWLVHQVQFSDGNTIRAVSFQSLK
jgi:hypothetical protein